MPQDPGQQPDQTFQAPQPDAAAVAPTPMPQPAFTPQVINPAQPEPQAVPQLPVPTPPMPMPQSPEPFAMGVPVPPPGLVSSPGPQAFAPVSASTGSRSKKPLLFGVAGVVVVALLVSGAFAYEAYANRISPAEVQDAQHTADTMISDINGAADADALATIDTKPSDINSDIQKLSGKLADAQKQYNLLKNAKVQHNSSVHKAFEAFSAKWPAYASYLQGSVSDVKILMPTLTDFENKIESLSKNTPTTTATLNTYLTNLKDITDSTSTKLSGVHMATPEDSKMLSATQTFLQATSKDVSLAQSDLNSGKDLFTVEDDLLKVDDAETTFGNTESTYNSSVSNHVDKLDPSHQFITFQNALDTLYTQVSH